MAAKRPGGGGAAGGAGAGARQHGHTNQPADQRQVWVLRGDRPTPVTVKVGVSDGSVSEIVEGDVKEGEEVITDIASGTSSPGTSKGGPRFRGF
mgnify:CR=1 FL=1